MQKVSSLTAEQLAQAEFAFHDRRLAPLLFRYKARHWPSLLRPEEQQRWLQHIEEVLTTPVKRGAISLEQYFARIDQLAMEHAQNQQKQELLQQLHQYGQMLASGALLQ